jgi:hypothetical protein
VRKKGNSRRNTLFRLFRSVAREAVVVAVFALTYVTVREFTEGNVATAMRHGNRLARAERHHA